MDPSEHACLSISPPEVTALLSCARNLQRAAAAGTTQPLLRGRKLALLCAPDDADAALFRRAAAELGAHVTPIRPSLSMQSTPQEVQHTARLLGRLYDAVACQGMNAALVRRIGAEAGVPFYDDIASAHHPSAELADALDGGTPQDRRRFVLQALLLTTLT